MTCNNLCVCRFRVRRKTAVLDSSKQVSSLSTTIIISVPCWFLKRLMIFFSFFFELLWSSIILFQNRFFFLNVHYSRFCEPGWIRTNDPPIEYREVLSNWADQWLDMLSAFCVYQPAAFFLVDDLKIPTSVNPNVSGNIKCKTTYKNNARHSICIHIKIHSADRRREEPNTCR